MMMEGAGFEVIDLGINNPVENYLEALEEHEPDILGMSALLTTTMPYMKVVIDTMKEKGIRDDYLVMVGGAPLNQEFATAVGADAYCSDAAITVETAKELMKRRHNLGDATAGRPPPEALAREPGRPARWRRLSHTDLSVDDEAAFASAGPARALVIACGALAREIVDFRAANGFDHLDITCLPAKLHNRPHLIP